MTRRGLKYTVKPPAINRAARKRINSFVNENVEYIVHT